MLWTSQSGQKGVSQGGGVKARENAKGYTTLLPSEKEMGIGAVVIKLTFFRHF